MTGELARQALASAFIARWVSAHPTYPCFIVGQSEPDLTTTTTPFCTFKTGVTRVHQSGLPVMRRYDGEMEVGLYVPMGQGTLPFSTMIDTVTNQFTACSISGIRMYGLTVLNRASAIGWQSRILLVRFSFDSTD